MPKLPTMSTADCEAELGVRGRLTVTSDNRRTVRKWLNAQGFPALFSGGLSMRELALAYNDTSGKALEGLRRKLSEAGEGGEEETGTLSLDQAQSIASAIAQSGQSGQTSRATSQAQETAETASRSQETASRNADTSDVDDAAKKLADALAQIAKTGKAVDADKVREIVREEQQDFSRAVDQKLAEAMSANVRRIEVKLPNQDAYQQIEGVQHPCFEKLLRAATCRDASGHHLNIWISGPAGSGKTFAAKMVAKALSKGFEYNGALGMAHELVGFRDAGGTYHDTPFRRGYTDNAVYLFDEVDGSDNSALLALNAALANGRASFPDQQVERHEGSVIIATANTWGLGATADYVGRAKIDAAFLDRFPVKIFWDYDEELERTVCGNAAWAKRVQKARKKARAAGIKVLISPRASIGGAALINGGFSEDDAAAMTYLANLTEEQRRMVEAA